jgi:hypothetical protein
MDELPNSSNLNAPSEPSAAQVGNAVKIIAISSRTDLGLAPHIRCPNCNSLVIVDTRNADDVLDPNGKRHFCSDVDRILHEEKCVINLQSLIQDYNQAELSNFQLELNLV